MKKDNENGTWNVQGIRTKILHVVHSWNMNTDINAQTETKKKAQHMNMHMHTHAHAHTPTHACTHACAHKHRKALSNKNIIINYI